MKADEVAMAAVLKRQKAFKEGKIHNPKTLEELLALEGTEFWSKDIVEIHRRKHFMTEEEREKIITL